ncbi:LuxR C-terminal-related transcriptional regulator, partial [Streptomyces sp. NPDC127068]|uniref:LuxR C-terminal-related transcriptional regulator n=1 Tax=Streptomyces sp. NPDC127068 TaxID=3347127 RepID=UPI0036549C53
FRIGEAGRGEEIAAEGGLPQRPVEHVLITAKPGTGRIDLAAADSATAEIVALPVSTRVLILTTYDTDVEIERAVEAGAVGYLLKDTTREQLADAIRSAARGETVLAPKVAERLVARMRRPEPVALTARERDVLSAVADGLSNAEIGRRLAIGEATVKTHLLRVFAKLDVSDRTRAVVVALERGLLARS